MLKTKTIVIAAALAIAGGGALRAEKAISPNGTMTAPSTKSEKGVGAENSETRSTTREMTNYSAAKMMTTLPEHTTTISNWYDQNVYDPQENKIGEIKDLLLDNDGAVQAVVISVGGFVGIGEKDVAVSFDSVHPAQRGKKWWLTMNASKDTLKSATGFRFDRSKQAWTMATR